MYVSPRFLCVVILFQLFPLDLLQAQTDEFHAAIDQLRAVDMRERGYPRGDVPPAAQKFLPIFKEGLRQRITLSLNAHAASSPEILRSLILVDLAKDGIEPFSSEEFENNYNPKEGDFGYLVELEVRQPTHHPELLAVVTTISIPCGSDSSLDLYHRVGSAWELSMVVESNGYADVSGAQGSFQFAVSPPDAEGNWFVVTADVNPWCSSNWQSLRYKVLRPGNAANLPQPLLKEETGIYIGVDQPYRLTVRQKGFEIRNVASQSLDAGLLTRVHINKYEVEGDNVKRIVPLALVPEDFLDEWVGMKWEDASRWISGSRGDELHEWHERLGRPGRDDFFTEFDFVQSCPSPYNAPRWQIGLLLEGSGEKELPQDLPDEVFFTIIKREAAFFLEGVATDRPPGCPGGSPVRSYSLDDPLH